MALLGAAAAGAALMYLLDPQRGNRRHKRLRDRMVHAGHVGADFLGTARRDAANRLRGVAAEARTALRDSSPDDRVLEERVRAELGRVVSHPGAIDVESIEGSILLRGFVLQRERERLINHVARVRGVEVVEDHLDVHETADNVPALQGAGRPRESRFELAQDNWSPAVRLVTGAAGAALATYGARERGIVGAVCSLAGLALLARSAINRSLESVVGAGNGRQAEQAQKPVTSDAPLEDGFAPRDAATAT